MDKWEYRLIDLDIEELNQLGAQGWEAVSIGRIGGQVEAAASILIKRRLTQLEAFEASHRAI